MNRGQEVYANGEAREPSNGRLGWREVVDISWRLLLVFVGIPVVWIMRSLGVIDLSFWRAVGISVVLFLAAIGAHLLAMVWTG